MNMLKSLFGAGSGISAMSAQEAHALINSSTPPFIVDVREPSEYQAGHIPEAKLLPLGELEARMDELPKNRQILCVCASGARSSMAAQRLARAGYTVINLRGGMMGWSQNRYPIKRGK